MVWSGKAPFLGWVTAAFFGLCALVFLVKVIDPRPRLVIDDDGIEVEPPVLGSDLDTFGRGTPEAEQDERGSPHAHTFAEIWQGEEPSLVFFL